MIHGERVSPPGALSQHPLVERGSLQDYGARFLESAVSLQKSGARFLERAFDLQESGAGFMQCEPSPGIWRQIPGERGLSRMLASESWRGGCVSRNLAPDSWRGLALQESGARFLGRWIGGSGICRDNHVGSTLSPGIWRHIPGVGTLCYHFARESGRD